MIGIAQYDSEEDPEEKQTESTGLAANQSAVTETPTCDPSQQTLALGKARETGLPKHKPLTDGKLKVILKEIGKAKSATAVVSTVRSNMESAWDFRWAAEAIYQISRRSTARTRKEWAADQSVRKLVDKLKTECADGKSFKQIGTQSVHVLLLTLDGLRRMSFSTAEQQVDALEMAAQIMSADGWKHPVKALARLFWLASPLDLANVKFRCFSHVLPSELRKRAPELDGADLVLLVSALSHEAARDVGLLEKVVSRLSVDGIHEGTEVSDLVEMAEGLRDLNVQEDTALRPLGQEILRRRGELNPHESHRVHAAFQAMSLPLPQVWMQPGAGTKREGAQIVTTQAFAPQEGHEKKRRGNPEVGRVSPPRVVRDMKMMSY